MKMAVRCSVKSRPGRVLVAALLVGASSCGSDPDVEINPARAIIETPGGRRIAAAGRASGRSPAVSSEDRVLIAKFAGAIPAGAHAALAAAGYREVSYLPHDALLLERSRTSLPAPAIPGLAAWHSYGAADRLSRELRPEALAARASTLPVPVMIHILPGHDREQVRAAIAGQGAIVAGEAQAGAFGRISALFSPATAPQDLEALANRSDVFFLERIHRVGLLNDRTAGTIQSGVQGTASAQTPIWNQGIRGENQIAGVLDTGLDANSCYYNGTALPVTNTWSQANGYGTATNPSHRKIVAYDFLYSCDQYSTANCEQPTNLATAWDAHGHGTHVTGNILGDSNSDPAVHAAQDGLAPAAKVVVQDGGYFADTCAELPGLGCPVVTLDPIFEQARLQGASVHNNSWGDNEEATPPGQSNYSARSQDVDRYMWDHREFLIVYAAGNSGAGNAEFSVGSPSTNKNGLSVGSARTSATSSDDTDISSFSSRGWTGDGRIKPDLMAPGCNSAATTDNTVTGTVNCGASGGCGTSYASPVAVGAALLARQYFTDGFYPSGARTAGNGFTPSAALVKAALINSAVTMTGSDNSGGSITPIPSNEQGWGRIQLDRTLLFTGAPRKLYVDDHRQGLPLGATGDIAYTFEGVAAGQALKVTLAWTDYPGAPDSPPASPSVTDSSTWTAPRLVNDLDLTVTGPGGTYLGNVFSAGASTTGGAADRRNNVEQVLLAVPTAGTYTVVVRPVAIVQANQEFALVVTGDWQSGGAVDGGVLDATAEEGSAPTDASPDVSIDGGPSTPDAADASDVPDSWDPGDAADDSADVADAVDTGTTDAPGGGSDGPVVQDSGRDVVDAATADSGPADGPRETGEAGPVGDVSVPPVDAPGSIDAGARDVAVDARDGAIPVDTGARDVVIDRRDAATASDSAARDGASDAAVPPPDGEEGGCNCSVGRRVSGWPAGWMLLALAFVRLARRRRR